MAALLSPDIQPPRALVAPPNRRPQGARQRLSILRGWEVRYKDDKNIEPQSLPSIQPYPSIHSFPLGDDDADTPLLFLQREKFLQS